MDYSMAIIICNYRTSNDSTFSDGSAACTSSTGPILLGSEPLAVVEMTAQQMVASQMAAGLMVAMEISVKLALRAFWLQAALLARIKVTQLVWCQRMGTAPCGVVTPEAWAVQARRGEARAPLPRAMLASREMKRTLRCAWSVKRRRVIWLMATWQLAA
jgi:hypothetical protein